MFESHSLTQSVGERPVRVDTALELLDRAAFRVGAGKTFFQFLGCMIDAVSFDVNGNKWVMPSDVERAVDNLMVAMEHNDPEILRVSRGLKVQRIVDIEEFVKSREYLNQKRSIRPRIMELLIDVFHSEKSGDYLEVVLGGGIGYGKSYSAVCGISYMTYILSCYHCPQIEFGIAPGTPIIFILQSLKMSHAKRVPFAQMSGMMKLSPYFTKHFPPAKGITSELRFPSEITVMPVSGSDTAALGMNCFGGMIDEMNFMALVADSQRASAARTAGGEYDQANKLYSTIFRRIKSRFLSAGKVPGKLFLVSSANYPGDFIDRKRAEAEQMIAESETTGRSVTIYYCGMPQWEAFEGMGKLSESRFLVEVGDESRRSRLLNSKSEAFDPNSIIEVPMDYYDDFRRDIDGAVREIAGIPIGGVGAFIPQRDKIHMASEVHKAAFEEIQLFTENRVDLCDYDGRLEKLINEKYLRHIDGADLVAHCDLALTGDSAGLCIGHCAGYQYVGDSFNWSQEDGRYVSVPSASYPVIAADGVLEIVPPANDEIDLNLIADLLTLVAARANFVQVTADQYQSASLLQRMRRVKNKYGRRVQAQVLSVDAQPGPYMEVKQALRDDRMLYPDVEKLKRELRMLQFDAKTKKIDHLPNESKDLSDSLAGVTWLVRIRNPLRTDVIVSNPDGKMKSIAFKKRRP